MSKKMQIRELERELQHMRDRTEDLEAYIEELKSH
jgi:predicted  nucleic acid-binding Zn-ribbon protein